jgi:hypothetical protein
MLEFSACRLPKLLEERHEGQGHREMFPASGKGKPLKAQAQGRCPHETRWTGSQVEQSVKSPRKAEGAAQSGQASPMLVATCFLKRRRAPNLKGARPLSGISHDLAQQRAACSSRSLNVATSAWEDGVDDSSSAPVGRPKTTKSRTSFGPSSRWERSTNTALGRFFSILRSSIQDDERRSFRW